MNASGIGAELSRARLARGLSLDELSRQTKISLRILELIEQGDFGELPGIVFTRNFVRQYAAAVCLDPEPLLAGLPQLDDSMRQLPAPPLHPRRRQRAWRSAWRGSGSSSRSQLVWLVLALGAGLAGWAHYHHVWLEFHWPQVNAASAPRPSVAQQPPQPETRISAADPGASAASAEDQAQDQAQQPAQQTVAVAVTALQLAWVQLVADGQTAFAGTLHPNETREVTASGKVKIVAGKEGGIEVSLNGKKLDPLEPSDRIRVVTLTAAGPEPPPASPKLPTEPDRL